MLHLVLGLVAIGIALFLWQAFPAFKWVLAAIVGIPVLGLLIATAMDKEKRNQEQAEQKVFLDQQTKQYEREQAELAKKTKTEEGKAPITYEQGKAVLKSEIQQIEQKEKSGQPLTEADINNRKQAQIWLESLEKNEGAAQKSAK